MPEFIVAIDHITYYAVQAEDEVTAIDLAVEGQGLEIDSETCDAYILTVRSFFSEFSTFGGNALKIGLRSGLASCQLLGSVAFSDCPLLFKRPVKF